MAKGSMRNTGINHKYSEFPFSYPRLYFQNQGIPGPAVRHYPLKGSPMKHATLVATVSAISLALIAPAALAQTEITGIDALDDRLDDIEETAEDDIERSEDESRFGNPEFRPGLSGSASLSYSGKSGTSDAQEFSAGARLRFAQGNLVQTLGAAIDFAEGDDGLKTKEDIFAVYDANLYFTDSFYGFVLGRISKDGLAEDALVPEDETRRDAFIGVGPGYRIFNTEQITWRVQAGIGISYLEDGAGNSETETGYIASSRFFYAFNENVFMTNDTDVLKSDTALRVNNDIGVNFRMSDVFSTRVSYLTEYDDSRETKTDNKLGLSLVYGF
jgi:putative salt-induced outer membrane protein